MKATPTETDREAAQLFQAVAGMRLAYFHIVNGREKYEWCRVRDAGAGAYGPPGAIDTDDNPTAGEMLAQVEAMRPGQAVSIVDRLHSLPGDVERRFAVLVEHDGTQTVATGPTRGAALVAAMKALKGAT